MIQVWSYLFSVAILGGTSIVFGQYCSLWLQAYFTGARIRFLDLVLMSLRAVSPKAIVQCRIMAFKSGLTEISTNDLQAHYLAGGDVDRVTITLIAANQAGINLDWNTAAAIDLAGRDVMEAVRVSVNPKVIDCPNPKDGGGDELYGIAKDGIQLKVRVRVTIRTNLSQLVGGATEATVIARIGQGIISAIGSCDSYRCALDDPTVITRQMITSGLDSQTAFSIVSIDVADIDVGTNIGAKLQIDQANADVRVARADAETRRAMAVARHQEMRAKLAKSRAMLVRAEAEIPSALAMAFRMGRLKAERPRRNTIMAANADPTTSDSFRRENQARH